MWPTGVHGGKRLDEAGDVFLGPQACYDSDSDLRLIRLG